MFKEMAEIMTDKEVERCMAILVDGSVVLSIERDLVQNAIDVTFRVIGDAYQRKYSLSLLPDSVQEISEGVELRFDREYLYRQYTIAKGYSEYWKSNMFIED